MAYKQSVVHHRNHIISSTWIFNRHWQFWRYCENTTKLLRGSCNSNLAVYIFVSLPLYGCACVFTLTGFFSWNTFLRSTSFWIWVCRSSAASWTNFCRSREREMKSERFSSRASCYVSETPNTRINWDMDEWKSNCSSRNNLIGINIVNQKYGYFFWYIKQHKIRPIQFCFKDVYTQIRFQPFLYLRKPPYNWVLPTSIIMVYAYRLAAILKPLLLQCNITKQNTMQ